MPQPVSGQPGEQNPATGLSPLRIGRLGDLIVSELNPRYYEAAINKRMFIAYGAAQALTVVGTAMVGLQLWNGSSGSAAVNAVLTKVGGFLSVTSATTTGILLASGSGQPTPPTSQTAATRVSNGYIGGPSPVCTATTVATFTAAPTAFTTLMHNTAAIATTGEDIGYLVDFEGSIIVPPQSYLAIAALGATAGAAAWTGWLQFEEVPV